jgi:pyruvate/2-oxoglutarate dehydrogenase complex dihydrolipoamide dehydrogenase (E3) component
VTIADESPRCCPTPTRFGPAADKRLDDRWKTSRGVRELGRPNRQARRQGQPEGEGAPKANKFDAANVCIGNVANIDGLELTSTGVPTDEGSVLIDDKLRTTDQLHLRGGRCHRLAPLADKAIRQGRVRRNPRGLGQYL